jgi:hypothetical protein
MINPATVREYNFLISIAGNSSSWRHTIEATSYNDAVGEIKQIEGLSTWRVMTPSENTAIRLTEQNRN